MRWNLAAYVRTVGIAVASAPLLAVFAADFPAPGEWIGPRGNATLDGHAQGQGAIHDPQIIWRHRVAGTVTRVAVSPHEENTAREIPPDDFDPPSESLDKSRWFDLPPHGEIEGVSKPIVPTGTTTYADVLPGVSGLEKLEFDSGFNLPTKDGQWQYGPGRMLAWREGAWKTIWESATVGRTFRPYPLVGDFDADGSLEVAVLPLRTLHIHDAATGELEQQCEFTEGRSYGFFGTYDFDNDGRSEFLVMADFAKHIDDPLGIEIVAAMSDADGGGGPETRRRVKKSNVCTTND